MHPAYFETRFRTPTFVRSWPAEFIILSAYATTGEVWTAAQNHAADQHLAAELNTTHRWITRIEGYSPRTAHAEPSWAVALSVDAACAIGLRYRQDALYVVHADELFVTHCGARRALSTVGSFRARLDDRTNTS